jgi:hypothetical protein
LEFSYKILFYCIRDKQNFINASLIDLHINQGLCVWGYI